MPDLPHGDHLIDPCFLEFAKGFPKFFRGADTVVGGEFGSRGFFRVRLVTLPNVGLSGTVLAEKAVMSKSVDEKAVIFGPDFFRPRLIPVAKERGCNGDVRIDGVTKRLALIFNCVVIILYPLARFRWVGERKCQRAQSQSCSFQNRFAPG